MRGDPVPVAVAASAGVGGIFGLLVGLGIVPLPGIGPPACAEPGASMIMSALLGALSGGFFAVVLCLFVLSIVARRTKQR